MVKATVYICTTTAIVDSIAIADVQTRLGAVSPDGMLDEPGENGGKLGVEGAGQYTGRSLLEPRRSQSAGNRLDRIGGRH